MFETLDKKGEEAAELSSRLIELKNQLLDQALFENKFLVTRVPLSELPLSPNIQLSLKAAEKATGKDALKKTKAIKRKDLIISFIHDTLSQGEYFLQIDHKEKEKDDPMMNMLSPKSGPSSVAEEKKLIPALDIKVLESVDSLTFSIILHDECLLTNYDVFENKSDLKMRKASQMLSFGLLGKSDEGDGGFPMAFESEHVPQIV